jgi:hypothetical protein
MDEMHRAKVRQRAEQRIAELDELQRQMLPPDTGHHIDDVDPMFLDDLDARRLAIAQALRRQQDEDFARAARESRRMQEESGRAQREAQARWDRFVAQFRALPPETARGTTIQAVLPAGRKVTRTFDPDAPGNLVYVWCAGQTIDAEDLLPEEIDVVAPVGGVRVDRRLGLREQGLSGRFVVVVSVKH